MRDEGEGSEGFLHPSSLIPLPSLGTDPAARCRGIEKLRVRTIPLAEVGGEPGGAPPGVPGGTRGVVGVVIGRPSSSPPSAIHRSSPLRVRVYSSDHRFLWYAGLRIPPLPEDSTRASRAG